MKDLITSLKNPLVREILLLQEKSRERNRQGLIPIEGERETSLAAGAGVRFRKVVYQPEIVPLETVQRRYGSAAAEAEFIPVSDTVFSKIAYRESTGGVVVIAEKPEKTLAELPRTDESVYIVLEGVEKPGNLGAICRVADGAGAAGVIVCDPLTDVYNPNAIRSSLGCVFTTNVVTSDFDSVRQWLKWNGIRALAAELTASEPYHRADLSGAIALVFGTEATGLTRRWIDAADSRIIIPMRGVIDSLNVTTSVAVLVYEAMRRRNFA
jgi:TrmH family RNA methyltransferase